jgi:hypothetical protein
MCWRLRIGPRIRIPADVGAGAAPGRASHSNVRIQRLRPGHIQRMLEQRFGHLMPLLSRAEQTNTIVIFTAKWTAPRRARAADDPDDGLGQSQVTARVKSAMILSRWYFFGPSRAFSSRESHGGPA